MNLKDAFNVIDNTRFDSKIALVIFHVAPLLSEISDGNGLSSSTAHTQDLVTLTLVGFGILLVLFGLGTIFIGLVLAMLAGRRGGNGRISGGGLIMIGPIPIIIGTDRKWVRAMAVIALALIVLFLISILGVRP
jgi:uncharacterized protein (TIGR00304 family)